MNRFVLSYVNTANATENYDHEFASTISLMAFVEREHPDYTSYQIIVVRQKAEAAE